MREEAASQEGQETPGDHLKRIRIPPTASRKTSSDKLLKLAQ